MPPSILRLRFGKPIILIGSVTVALIIVGYWLPKHPFKLSEVDSRAEDPRLTFATPFENVRPSVRYVGDERCAECHATIAEKYPSRSRSSGKAGDPSRTTSTCR